MASDNDKSIRMRGAAHAKWARTVDRSAATKKARVAWLTKLANEIDPEGVLPEGIRLQRAEQLRRARLLQASAKSAAVRRARKEAS